MNRKYINCILIVVLSSLLLTSGCSLIELRNESSTDEETANIQDIIINQEEIDMIENIDERMESVYELEAADYSQEDIRDPFKPYYIEEGQEKENMLLLESLYSDDGTWYAEVKFNGFLYKLSENDIFAEIYQIKAINENSVVLLKGDEVITIFLGQLLYD